MTTMVENHIREWVPAATISLEDLRESFCPHCLVDTVQVGPAPEGWPVSAEDFDEILKATGVEPEDYAVRGSCLQCIADGGSCCSLKHLNRWKKK